MPAFRTTGASTRRGRGLGFPADADCSDIAEDGSAPEGSYLRGVLTSAWNPGSSLRARDRSMHGAAAAFQIQVST
jgi:hypothetical protein